LLPPPGADGQLRNRKHFSEPAGARVFVLPKLLGPAGRSCPRRPQGIALATVAAGDLGSTSILMRPCCGV